MSANDHPRFPHLFRPYTLKDVTIRNRIAISAHFAGWWVDGGLPSDAFVAYVEERAKGGVGLFVIGATSPERGSGWMENLDDSIIPRYRALTEAGHRHGMAVFAQLCHPGFRPVEGPEVIIRPPSMPGTQPYYRAPKRPAPTIADLHRLIASHGAAAGRAAAGGVDGVELHSHESFLHSQMLTPLWNHRTDEYGGSLDNRMRFLVETLQVMREAIGPELPLGVRLKLADMMPGGMEADEYREVVRRLEATGLIDYLIVTGGDGRFHHGPMPRPEGEWLGLVRELRATTKLTLLHAGRIATPEMAEAALAENVVDLVCMTKTHIADPHFARKVFEGRLDDIRYCTRCLQACHGHMDRMTCVYNPVTSREATWAILEPAERKKRVVVVGAGPAGMECALTAAQRGHEVTVLEKADRVGGQIWVGAASPLRKSWARIAEFYTRQAAKGLFAVNLNTEATGEAVLSRSPDAVVIATGSQPNRFTVGGREALTVHEVIAGKAEGARRAVLYDREGFNRALVAADYLSAKGVSLDFVTSLPHICGAVEGMMLEEMWRHLEARGVRFWPGYEAAEWTADGTLCLRSIQTAEEAHLDAVDTLVATVGSTSVASLAAQLRDRVPELHVIGDANFPQTVEQATYQGGRIGRLL